MSNLRSALALILASSLCAPASAQVKEVRLSGGRTAAVPQVSLGALGAALVKGAPGLTGGISATLTPTLAAPALAAPKLSPGLSAAVLGRGEDHGGLGQAEAPSMKVTAVSEAVAPALQALKAPELKGEGAASAAESMMSPIIGKSAAAPATGMGPSSPQAQDVLSSPKGIKLRGSPLLKKVAFSAEVSAQHQSLFLETLTRRKAGWIRQLAAMGVKLEGPVQPQVTVKSAKEVAKGAKVQFTVEWAQSETRLGSFLATVTLKNVNPELRRLPAPEPAKEKQIRVRFKKTVVADADGLNVEVKVTEADIEAYLEEKGLRVLSKGYGDNYWRVSVTGQARADAVAREISGKSIVLYATPETFTVPDSQKVQLVFKKSTVRSIGGINVETSVDEGEIGALLASQGLRVLGIDYYGTYTVGAEDLDAAAAAQRLQGQAGVPYATPVVFTPPVSSQLIISFRDNYVASVGGMAVESSVSEDDVASLLRRYGLVVVRIVGTGSYKVARVSDAVPAKDILAAVAAEPVVKSAITLGGVTEQEIQSAAKGVISHKGGIWSATEYNMVYSMSYSSLEQRGATPEQLKLFEKLCDEAPVAGGRFNPWSGD